MHNSENKAKILRVDVSRLNKENVITNISKFLDCNNKHYIVTPNPEFLLEAQKNEKFREILNNADLAIADGIGLLWAAKFLSIPTTNNKIARWFQIMFQYKYTLASILFFPKYVKSVIPERIAGSDLIWNIIKLVNDHNKSIYLLGAADGVAQKAAQVIQKKYPDIKIAGVMPGSPNEDQDIGVAGFINMANPDIIFVAYGAPRQEEWISRNLSEIESIKLAMGVGGSFDFIAGEVDRAPEWMRSIGLEWLYRLIKEPKRLKRIYNATVKFSFTVLKYKLRSNV